MFEEILDLLTSGWIALSEPFKEILNRKRTFTMLRQQAVVADESQKKNINDICQTTINLYDNSKVSSYLFIYRGANKQSLLWTLMALDSNDKCIWKTTIKCDSSAFSFEKTSYIINRY